MEISEECSIHTSTLSPSNFRGFTPSPHFSSPMPPSPKVPPVTPLCLYYSPLLQLPSPWPT